MRSSYAASQASPQTSQGKDALTSAARRDVLTMDAISQQTMAFAPLLHQAPDGIAVSPKERRPQGLPWTGLGPVGQGSLLQQSAAETNSWHPGGADSEWQSPEDPQKGIWAWAQQAPNMHMQQQTQEYLDEQVQWHRQMEELRSENQREVEGVRREKDEVVVERQARHEIYRLRQLLRDHGIRDEGSADATDLKAGYDRRQRTVGGAKGNSVAWEEHMALQKKFAAAEDRVRQLEQYVKDQSAKSRQDVEVQVKEKEDEISRLRQVILTNSMELLQATNELDSHRNRHRQLMNQWESGMRRILNGAEQLLGQWQPPDSKAVEDNAHWQFSRTATKLSLTLGQGSEGGDVDALRKMLKDVLVHGTEQRNGARERMHAGAKAARRPKLRHEVNEDLDVAVVILFQSLSGENEQVVVADKAHEAVKNWYMREVVWLDGQGDDVHEAFANSFSGKEELSMSEFKRAVQLSERAVAAKLEARLSSTPTEKDMDVQKMLTTHGHQAGMNLSRADVMDVLKEVTQRFCPRAEEKRILRWCSFILRWLKDHGKLKPLNVEAKEDQDQQSSAEEREKTKCEDSSSHADDNKTFKALLLAHPMNSADRGRPPAIETSKPDARKGGEDLSKGENGHVEAPPSPVLPTCGACSDSTPSSRDTSPGRGQHVSGNGHFRASQAYLPSTVPFLTHLVNDIRNLLLASEQAAAHASMPMQSPMQSPGGHHPSPQGSPAPIGSPTPSPRLGSTPPFAAVEKDSAKVSGAEFQDRAVGSGQRQQQRSQSPPQAQNVEQVSGQHQQPRLNAMPLPNSLPQHQPAILTPQAQEQAVRSTMNRLFDSMWPTRQNIAQQLIVVEKALRALERELRAQCEDLFKGVATKAAGALQDPPLPEDEARQLVPVPDQVQVQSLSSLRRAQMQSSTLLAEFVQLPHKLKAMFDLVKTLQNEVESSMVPLVLLQQAEGRITSAHLAEKKQAFLVEVLQQRIEALNTRVHDQAAPYEASSTYEARNLEDNPDKLRAELAGKEAELRKLQQAVVGLNVARYTEQMEHMSLMHQLSSPQTSSKQHSNAPQAVGMVPPWSGGPCYAAAATPNLHG
mmetsp:Transcript_3664/g.9304  ORF Transcript_3664/g.9304 Transcript_3664/m.9304 type:complete len:1082 (-) Transcript_3664:211-3456(-)